MGPRHKCTVPSIGPLLRFAIEALMPEHFGFGADRDMHFAAVTCSLQQPVVGVGLSAAC